MQATDIVKVVCATLLVVGLGVLLGLKVIDWSHFVVGLGLIAVPSPAAPLVKALTPGGGAS